MMFNKVSVSVYSACRASLQVS